jgi:transposase
MKAIHGGQANNARIDSPKIAALLRGGMLPKAEVYPAERRGTRDRLRRRRPLMRKRSARWSPVPPTNSPDNRPDIGKHIASQANRAGVAERVNDPAVHKTIEVDLARITSDDARLRDLERSLLKTATQHEAHTLYGHQPVPGIGQLLRRVRLDEIQDSGRLPSVQDVASYARVVQGRKASAGKRVGTSGKNIGNAHLTWAFSEAATVCLRHHPHGQTLLPRWEKTHGQGKALTILAHKVARAVSDMRKRNTAFARDIFLHASRRRAGEPAVSLDTHGISLHPARCLAC